MDSRITDYENTSVIDSSNDGDELYNEPMYQILGQFLVTKDNKNIATVIDEFTNEIKTISKILETISLNIKALSLSDPSILLSQVESQPVIETSSLENISPSSSPVEDS